MKEQSAHQGLLLVFSPAPDLYRSDFKAALCIGHKALHVSRLPCCVTLMLTAICPELFHGSTQRKSPEDSAKRYSFEREVISNHSVLCSCCYTLKFLVILNNVVLNNLEHKGSQLLVSPICWEAEKGGPRMWSQHGLQRNHALKNHSGRSAGNLEDGLLLSQSNSPASQVPTTPTLKPEGMWYWLWV